MSAANFSAELGDELLFEGGFVDNPADPGGITDFGITLATLSHWLGRQATVAELRGLSMDDKGALYRSMFWNPIQGDSLPSGLDLEVFDMAVNGGPSRATKMLQTILGVVVDGAIGPVTLGAAERMNAGALVRSYSAARTSFYRGLSTFPTFGYGWLARVASCEAKALALLA